MTTFDLILPYAPLLTIGVIIVGAMTAKINAVTARRARFVTAWTEFAKTEHYLTITKLSTASEIEILFDKSTRINTLTTLSALERLGRSASATRADWELVLPLDIHAGIKSMIVAAAPLIVVVRQTSVPLEVRCYNGHRSRAFANILNNFR